MKVEYKIKDNKISVTGMLKPRAYKIEPISYITREDIEAYCKEKNIPIGNYINCVGPLVCSNDSVSSCTKTWVFQISNEYKKSLILKKKAGNIKEKVKRTAPRRKKTKPVLSARARASRIVAEKKEKHENKESETE